VLFYNNIIDLYLSTHVSLGWH